MECSTTKASLEGLFWCCFIHPPLQLRQQRLFPGSTTAEWSQFPSSGSASLTQHHHVRSPSRTPMLFPGRILFPRRLWTTGHQPCSSHSRSWLIYAQQKLEDLLISPLRMSSFHVFFLIILVSSLPEDAQALDSDPCICTTQAESVVTKTLISHTCYSCAGIVVGSCTYNHTIYSLCFHDRQCIHFNPICCPQEQWLGIQSFTSTVELIIWTQVYAPKGQFLYTLMCAL
jgi:hypothetical protein